jgi:hypothetical protein
LISASFLIEESSHFTVPAVPFGVPNRVQNASGVVTARSMLDSEP